MGASSEEKQVRKLLRQHFDLQRTKGGHEVWTREGLARPIIVSCSGRSRAGRHKHRLWKATLADLRKLLEEEE